METTIDRFGRILIPKRVRDDLGLRPGTVLRVEERERAVSLIPLEAEDVLEDREGVLVFTGRALDDLAAAVAEQREARIADLGAGGPR